MDENLNEKTPYAPADDDFVIGAGFTVDETLEKQEEVRTRTAKKKKKKANKGCLSAAIWLISIGLVAVLLAAFVLLFFSDYLGIGRSKNYSEAVEISQGMNAKEIAEELHDARIINSPLLFRVYTKLKGCGAGYKYGVYTFNNEMSYENIAEKLQTEGAKAETKTVTIRDGATVDEICELLAKEGICSSAQFKTAVREAKMNPDYIEDIPTSEVYYRLEGYLFPETYSFYSYGGNECGELAVRKMVDQLDKNFTPAMKKQAKKMGRSIHEIMTMASIIQLEAGGNPQEMKNVSAVFYNRLSWDEPKLLGSSPTADYPYGSDRYNTNTHEGLPPGPLCSPCKDAIMAALYPTENFDSTYFVTDANGVFYYNKTYAAHQQTISSLKRKGIWLG